MLRITDELIEAMEEEGFYCEVEEDYEGRGSYGRVVKALVVEDPKELAWAMGRIQSQRPDFKVDNLGNNYVCY